MTEATPINPATVRQLLLAAFTPDDLRRFCQDHPAFQPVLADLGVNYSLNQMADTLIDYCQARLYFGELLTEVKRVNPRRYAEFAAELAGLVTVPTETLCPYRGLEPFEAEHAEFYFGRKVMTDQVVSKLRDHSLVAVVGPSGCGKSSLVRAGLITALQKGALPNSEDWIVRLFRPGTDPLRAWAVALYALLEPKATEVDLLTEVRRLANGLLDGTILMADLASRLRQKHGSVPRFVLIADQFEELYTECRDENLRRAFVEALLATAEEQGFSIVLTLRADFYGHILSDQRLGKAVDSGLVNVLPMSDEELRLAIEQPAFNTGCSFEPGLVDRIMHNLLGEPGNLPLLEFALTELWARQTEQRTLAHRAYEAIGGVEGAISQRAEAVYRTLVDKGKEETVRRVLLRLTHYGESAVVTRRRAAVEDLVTPRTPREEIELVIKALADARLVVTSYEKAPASEAKANTAEVSHEALIRGWERLRRWLDEDRAFVVWQERLAAARRIWQDSAEDEGALLHGAPLSEAEGWLAKRCDDLNNDERSFIEAGLAGREAQRERELASARELAEAHKRRAEDQARASRRLRGLAASLAVVFVLAVVAAWIAWGESRQAQRQADTLSIEVATRSAAEDSARAAAGTAEAAANAEGEARELAQAKQAEAEQQSRAALARQLASQSVLYYGRDMELALLLAAEAVSTTLQSDGYATLEADSTLRELLTGSYEPFLTLEKKHAGAVRMAAFSPDGKRLVTAGADGTARVWDAGTGRELRVFEKHSGGVNFAAFSPGGSDVVSTSADGTARLWDASTGEEKAVFGGYSVAVEKATFSPDGSRIITVDGDGSARLWDIASGKEVVVAAGWPEMHSSAFSPDGTLIVEIAGDRTARVWNAGSGKRAAILRGHTGPIESAVFSPDGTRIVTASDDHTARVWDANTGQELAVLKGHASMVTSAEFSPDGRRILTVGTDVTARIWDAATGKQLIVLRGDARIGFRAAFSLDGARIVTMESGRAVRTWSPDTGEQLSSWDGRSWGPSYQLLSFTGSHIIISESGGEVQVWDPISGERLDKIEGSIPFGATFSPDGTRVAYSTDDGSIKVWDVISGRALPELKANTSASPDIAFSQDGDRIVTAESLKPASIWDVATGKQLIVLGEETGSVVDMLFSPDGARMLVTRYNGVAGVWDTATGAELARVNGYVGGVQAAAYTPQGVRIVTMQGGGSFSVWDLITGNEISDLGPAVLNGSGAAFSPDGRFVVTTAEKIARVWDASTGNLLQVLEEHAADINDAAFSADGRSIITASEDKTARVWDVESGRPLGTAAGHKGAVWTAAFSPDGQRILTVSADETVRLWKLNTRQYWLHLAGHTEGVFRAVFDPSGRFVGSAGQDGVARIWSTETGQEVAKLEGHGQVSRTNTECPRCVGAISFSPSGDRIATAGWDGTARVWDPQTGRQLLVLEGHTGRLTDVAFSPVDPLLVTSSNDDDSLRLWDGSTGKELFIWQIYGPGYVAFSHDGRWIAAPGADGKVRIYDPHTGDERTLTGGTTLALAEAVFSPDGKRIAAAGFGGVGLLWDAQTGNLLAKLQGHVGTIWQIRFSPRGDLIATAGEDETARLWDAESGRERAVLRGHERAVWSVAFRPDGKQLATGGADNTVRLWSTQSGYAEATLPSIENSWGRWADWKIQPKEGVIESDVPIHMVFRVSYSPSGDYVVAANLDGSVDIYLANLSKLLEIARDQVTRELTCQERVQFLRKDLQCIAAPTSVP